jgi:hypothetical protein
MLPIEITVKSIERQQAAESLIEQFALDSPQASPTSQDHHLLIAGWVLAKEGLTTGSVEITEKDRVLKRARVNVPRPDVLNTVGRSEGLSDRIGFHFEISILGLPQHFELELRASVRRAGGEAETVTLFRIKGRKVSKINLHSNYQPVQVTAIGRSGTTLLMQVLGQHPEILTTNFYPYELRQASYWLHFLKTASAPADFEASAHPDKFEGEYYHIGHNPYSHPEYINQYKNPQVARRYYTESTFSSLAQLCIARIDDYYQMIAKEERRPRAKLFAEKALPGLTQNICRDLYQAPKEIILTRDFRDMLCSAKSFNSKRNNQAFGRDKVNDDFEWVDRISKMGARRLSEAWQERASHALHVRYEDLVTQPEQQILRIFEYLNIDTSPELIAGVATKIFSQQSDIATHSTTSSPQASIGRWRIDMPMELQEYCRAKLGSILSKFGYIP